MSLSPTYGIGFRRLSCGLNKEKKIRLEIPTYLWHMMMRYQTNHVMNNPLVIKVQQFILTIY